ncbi:MAG: anti-sigma factor family protein [Blastocatellia bacterium]
MNCERYQNELEDFLYGELTGKRTAEIRSHLIGCSDCAALRDQLERENELFAQFYEETAMEPGSEIWNAIHARIATGPAAPVKQKSANWFRGWFDWPSRPAALRQAAFAVLLIALSVAATTFFLKRGSDKPQDVVGRGDSATSPTPQISLPTPTPANLPAEQPPKPVVIPVKPAPPRKLTEQEVINQQIARAEREYQGAIRLLDRAIARRRDSLDPNLIREYELSLALIDDSIARSRRALREQPNDVTAGQFLLAAYAKKVELMQDIAMQ